MKNLIKVYKVLSDETRLRILNILQERSCCVCEVMQALEISQSKASRGLSALYDVGILTLHKEGLWSLYSIDWDGMDKKLKTILKTTTDAFNENKTMQADRERLKKARRVGPGCMEKACKKESMVAG